MALLIASFGAFPANLSNFHIANVFVGLVHMLFLVKSSNGDSGVWCMGFVSLHAVLIYNPCFPKDQLRQRLLINHSAISFSILVS